MDVYGALADPIRRDLLRRVAAQACRVVDLAAAHPVSRPAISRHLRVLGQAGLVGATDRGRERYYHLEPGPLGQIRDLVDELTGAAAASGRDTAASAPAGVTARPPITGRHLDALATEVHRAGRDRRRDDDHRPPATGPEPGATTDQESA